MKTIIYCTCIVNAQGCNDKERTKHLLPNNRENDKNLCVPLQRCLFGVYTILANRMKFTKYLHIAHHFFFFIDWNSHSFTVSLIEMKCQQNETYDGSNNKLKPPPAPAHHIHIETEQTCVIAIIVWLFATKCTYIGTIAFHSRSFPGFDWYVRQSHLPYMVYTPFSGWQYNASFYYPFIVLSDRFPIKFPYSTLLASNICSFYMNG